MNQCNIICNSIVLAPGLVPDFIYTKYSIGSSVYNIAAATLRGKLEKIVIKKFKILNLGTVIYVDTFNWLWNENELCTSFDAINYAINYWENNSIQK